MAKLIFVFRNILWVKGNKKNEKKTVIHERNKMEKKVELMNRQSSWVSLFCKDGKGKFPTLFFILHSNWHINSRYLIFSGTWSQNLSKFVIKIMAKSAFSFFVYFWAMVSKKANKPSINFFRQRCYTPIVLESSNWCWWSNA